MKYIAGVDFKATDHQGKRQSMDLEYMQWKRNIGRNYREILIGKNQKAKIKEDIDGLLECVPRHRFDHISERIFGEVD